LFLRVGCLFFNEKMGPKNLVESVSRCSLLHRQKILSDSDKVGIGQLDFGWMDGKRVK